MTDRQSFWPHFGQNLAGDVMGAPQRGHEGPALVFCWAPQCGQNMVPGAILPPQAWHCAAAAADCNGVPQLTQRRAVLGLSEPQFGHGLYSAPQCGQNRSVVKCFLEQLAQYISRTSGPAGAPPMGCPPVWPWGPNVGCE